jgi:hypothetical protein
MGKIMNKSAYFLILSLGTGFLASFFLCPAALAAGPGIFHCGEPGNQSWSQIPCEETSEQVIIEDHVMITGLPESGEGSGAEGESQTGANGQAQATSNVQAFINQLEKQRGEQLAEIDRNIQELERGSGAAGLDAEGEVPVESTQLMATLKETRKAIVSEYDAMISAAQQRVDGT